MSDQLSDPLSVLPPLDEDDDTPKLAVDRRITVSMLLTGRSSTGPGDSAAAPLLTAFARHHGDSHEKIQWLRRSYQVAAYLHGDQMRKSGAPYITHPLAVATILAEMGMDATTLVAALLHDTVEDTDYTLGECRADFGSEVALLVDGVTKLDGKRLGKQAAERETYRKMVLAAGADLRVLLIKLVDRLHNLRTLGSQPAHKQARIAQQSMDLLVPFCDRLGLYRLKREMEDISFRYLEPSEYDAILRAVTAGQTERDNYFARLTAQLETSLRDRSLKAAVAVRRRHTRSLYDANRNTPLMLSPGRVCRVVVVVEGAETDCWVALGAVHHAFPPINGRMRDYVASPKYNLYQSLHTSVVGPGGERIDVMIRTPAMQDIAEDGIAATIREISLSSGTEAAGLRARHNTDLEWLQRLLAWQGTPTEEYLDDLRTELRGGSIAVIAPDGEVVTLPSGATGIDYAFARGGHVGSRVVSLRVNGQLAPVTAPLTNGDQVEAITTRRNSDPSPEWLGAARTSRARRSIRANLRRGDDYADVDEA